jgi:hypothetical protein
VTYAPNTCKCCFTITFTDDSDSPFYGTLTADEQTFNFDNDGGAWTKASGNRRSGNRRSGSYFGFTATWKHGDSDILAFGGGVLSRWGSTDGVVFSQETLVYKPTLGGSPGKSYASFDRARTQYLQYGGALSLNYQSAGGITVITRVRFPGAAAASVRFTDCFEVADCQQ